MLFNSLHFAIFFPVITLLYFGIPHRYRWAMLLAASCYFYMAFIPVYILILFFTIGVDYFAGILIQDAGGRSRKFFLMFSVLANIGALAVFKYFNFLNGILSSVWGSFGLTYPVSNLSIILPIGLSFHTFQALSYTIEVYRGRQAAERHLGIFALYVMFYPQLVAGPIERPQNLLPQFRTVHTFDYDRVTDGLKMMAWGLFMKAVVADNLAPFVNFIYNDVAGHAGLSLLVATVFFAFQIYCDFAGYSYIALGAAKVMGFRLMENFRQPYFAASVSDFWRRWHISLSTWFRDYVYFGLGGNRVAKPRWYLNLLIVFAVSGLWHGANWTFVVWGLLHGTYIILSLVLAPVGARFACLTGLDRVPRVMRGLQISLTFLLVCFAWIFFRANNVSDAFFVITHMWGGLSALSRLDLWGVAPGLVGIAIVLAAEIAMQRESVWRRLAMQPAALRWAMYYALVLFLIFWGSFGQEQFIYFQF